DPTYIRAVLDGMTSAIKANHPIPWPSLWALITHVAEQRAESAPEPPFDRDPDFSWAKSSVIRLLEAALWRPSSGLDSSCSEHSLANIQRLATGDDPRLDEAHRNGPSELATEALVLTSIRARALGLLVDYVCWLKRNAGSQFSMQGHPTVDE